MFLFQKINDDADNQDIKSTLERLISENGEKTKDLNIYLSFSNKYSVRRMSFNLFLSLLE